MPDGISFKLLLGPVNDEVNLMMNRVDRATMWGLRDTGRVVVRTARKNAPKYKGTDPRAMKGLAKKAIRSSRQLKRTNGHGIGVGRLAGEYRIAVGPRGPNIHLYAPKIEAKYHFMQKGWAAANAQSKAIHERAWERSMAAAVNKYGR